MSQETIQENSHTLVRPQAPGSFLEGFPIGNGRISAMVMGTYPEERLYLNHEWLWTAKWRDQKAPDESAKYLPELKKLLREGKYEQGTRFANDHFSPRGGSTKIPCRIDSFVSAGYFSICPDISVIDHTRSLDMEKALVTSTLRYGNLYFTREAFASGTDGLIHLRYRMQDGTPFSGICKLGRNYEKGVELDFITEKDHLLMQGEVPGGTPFRVEAFLHCQGGKATIRDKELLLEDVTELIVLLDVDVDHARKGSFRLSPGKAFLPDWEKDLASHVEKWQKYYYRSRITIPGDELISRYCNFGKYLLLSTLITAELPPNLQGKWNLYNQPPWSCDYHLNINLQMNHWGCCPLALEELNLPFFDYLERAAKYGKLLAEKTWGCRGIFLSHSTDVWAQATPEAYGYGVWLCSQAWLAQHFMQYYRYTLDEDFLRERAWPFLRECALFFEDILEKDAEGLYQIIPSQSPENRFKNGGAPISICISSSCDIELVQELFRDAIFLAERLKQDSFLPKWRDILANLPPLAIGRDGRLLEWGKEEFIEEELGHRHISHLVGLFPGSVITEKKTPELYKAALRSLEVRLENFHEGGFVPGWSRAILSNYFALAGEGDRAVNEIRILAEKQSSHTLLDLHPPQIFQIDGNLGILSSVAAMLVQTKDDVLTLLPALPSSWQEGEAVNLHGEKCLSIDLQWENGSLRQGKITAGKEVEFFFQCPENCRMEGAKWEKVPGETFVKVTLGKGSSLQLTKNI